MMRPPQRRRLARWFRRLALALPATGLLLAGTALLFERGFDRWNPYPQAPLAALETSTVCLAADGTWLQVLPTSQGERTLATRWDDLSPLFRKTILTAEDDGFFEHSGVDAAAVMRASWQNLASGRVVSGASTLTMQAVRIVEPRPRTLRNKVIEALRARQLERTLGKRAVLDLWVTHVPMGGTLRGFESASRYWFGRPAAALAVHEAALLVAMVPAPSARAADRNPALLRDRRDRLIDRLARAGHLDVATANRARSQPLGARRHPWPQHAWHLCQAERARAPVECRDDRLTTGADLDLQRRATEVLEANGSLPGDGTALVVLDRSTGALRSLIGNRTQRPGWLDLARRRRSVGSTLKPFLFGLAHGRGLLPDGATLDDTPARFGNWRPANFDGRYRGRMRPADALATSENLPAIHCLNRLGVGEWTRLLDQLGLPVGDRPLHLDAALGTLAATPLELARAWQRFVRGDGAHSVPRPSVAWTLRALSSRPPGGGTKTAGRVAWKSGTSSGHRDAWCVGVTAHHVIVLWLGNRSGRGESDLIGTRLAARLLGDLVAAFDDDGPSEQGVDQRALTDRASHAVPGSPRPARR